MFTAGISAGFFILERMRLLSGASVMLTAGVLVYLASEHKRTAFRLTAVMLAGFLLFTLRYIHYGMIRPSAITDTSGDSPRDIYELQGRVIDAVLTDHGLRLTVVPDGRRCRVQVNMYSDNAPDPADYAGMHVTATGEYREIPAADNPECFDYRVYLRSKGIGAMYTARRVDISEDPAGYDLRGIYRRHLYLLRDKFLSEIDDEEIRTFIRGAVFGDKTQLDEDIREDFSFNGTGHILAVSGLHTGFLYALLRILSGRKRMLSATVLTICMLLMYGEMTMWSPSAVRAVTVLTLSLLSMYAGRPFDLLSAASASALIMLAHEPYQLMNSGFQMSFMALMGIAFLTEPLAAFIGEGAAVMAAVQLGAAPLTAFIFHRFNILTLFINIPVIFLASLLVPVCLTALLITAAAGTPGSITVTLIEGLSEFIIRINEKAAAGGYFSNQITSGNMGWLIFLYLVMFLASSEWFRIKLIRKEYRSIFLAVICMAAMSLCYGAASYNVFADDTVVFVSVGQGDCTHIRSENGDVLIDGGGNTERNVGKDTLMPYLLGNGADRIEMGLVTHLHTDHCLGLLQLAEVFPTGCIGIPEDYRKPVEKLRAAGETASARQESGNETERDDEEGGNTDDLIRSCRNIRFITTGTRIEISDDICIDPVWPPRGKHGDTEIEDPNENNMVYIVNCRGVKVMVTGDLLEEDELEMIRYYRGTDTLKCDILKVAHHGSKSSSSEEFLDAVRPSVAVIQVGRNNFYGHPHDQTLERLKERGIEIYRTDLNGAVGIDLNGKHIKTEVMRSCVGDY